MAAAPITQVSGAPAAESTLLDDASVERWLQTGENAGLLEDHFGHEQYVELRQLARDAAVRSVRGGPPVLILPGIMGSTLSAGDDLLWLDPFDVVRGHLENLALPEARFTATGVILFTYLKLKLKLKIAGYDAQFHPFDWRRSIPEIARGLRTRIRALNAQRTDGASHVSLVAHSMGGLVAREALRDGDPISRLIMLGTPNHGSFVPALAFRGTYSIVQKLALIDLQHSAEELSRDVFTTFPGLTQLLAFSTRAEHEILYAPDNWPEKDKGLVPRIELLKEARRFHRGMPPGAPNYHVIAGVGEETVVRISLGEKDGRAEFVYHYSTDGDGTVPFELCQLEGSAQTLTVEESHGSLPNNRHVIRAVIDLLDRGQTDVLTPSKDRASTRARETQRWESDVRNTAVLDATRGGMPSRREQRTLIAEVASPTARALEGVSTPDGVEGGAETLSDEGFQHSFDRVVIGRRRQHRIDLRFAHGSITESDTRAIAIGVFRDVQPGGPARAIDQRLASAITELFRRRMFSANVGEVFVLPTGRHLISADFIALVGMGSFDRFTDEVLQTAAENVMRTFVATQVEEFSTVLLGGGSGESPERSLRGMLNGFLRGLRDADVDHHFRRIVICETDASRFNEIKKESLRLSSTSICHDVELTMDQVELPETVIRATRSAPVQRPDPVYLIVRLEASNRTAKRIDIRSSLLTAGAKAAVVSDLCSIAVDDFEVLRSAVVNNASADFSTAGVALANGILARQIVELLPRYRDHHLVIVHDAWLSKVPWEALAFRSGNGHWYPAYDAGLSHRYAAENLSVAKWLEERVHGRELSMLMVVNPTGDLGGAEKECAWIRERFSGQVGLSLFEIGRDEATRPALLREFSSGRYDIIHYAGHAFFDPENPERSGLICAGGDRLTGADLAGLSSLPTLVFFNACEAARVRFKVPQLDGATKVSRSIAGIEAKRKDSVPTTTTTAEPTLTRGEHLDQTTGLAEAFMRGGVANLVGTYWPVEDRAAGVFAQEFYTRLFAGASINEAVTSGRSVLQKSNARDWANYIFYGNPDFRLKADVHESPRTVNAP